MLGLEKQKLTEGKELIKYFCQPCAPTKTNGQRTRNLPAHAPDKWLAFKKYNIRDVETEMSIQTRLAKYTVPDSVWNEYHIDQEINDRGVSLDMELVRQAIQMDGRSRSELTQAMKELTALENPNSVQQIQNFCAAAVIFPAKIFRICCNLKIHWRCCEIAGCWIRARNREHGFSAYWRVCAAKVMPSRIIRWMNRMRKSRKMKCQCSFRQENTKWNMNRN